MSKLALALARNYACYDSRGVARRNILVANADRRIAGTLKLRFS